MPCRVDCTLSQVCRHVDCGPATSCRVECAVGQACDGIDVYCGGGPCRVACANGQGCNSLQIFPQSSLSLCLACGGSNGCNSVRCNGAPAAGSCSGNHCNLVTGCNALAAVEACPP
jgi:hypothetical protein